MVPQWHRGTEWGRDMARRFHDEVASRAAAGDAACPGERLRLMGSAAACGTTWG
jgi:hypothetical protein